MDILKSISINEIEIIISNALAEALKSKEMSNFNIYCKVHSIDFDSPYDPKESIKINMEIGKYNNYNT